MKPPYFVINIKADLSLDDCVEFLNAVTEEGNRQFCNLYVALPLSRLQEMMSAFPKSGITFGTAMLNRADGNEFTAPVAAKVVKNAGGHFTLIGSVEERRYFIQNNEQLKAKLFSAKEAELKFIYCFGGTDPAALEEQLTLLKETGFPDHEVHPMIIYELPFTQFASYLPSDEELNAYATLSQTALKNVFGEDSKKIQLLAALPNDLVGFTSLIENLPFAGAFFIKSGIYPHTVHQETLQLIHVHCKEEEETVDPSLEAISTEQENANAPSSAETTSEEAVPPSSESLSTEQENAPSSAETTSEETVPPSSESLSTEQEKVPSSAETISSDHPVPEATSKEESHG